MLPYITAEDLDGSCAAIDALQGDSEHVSALIDDVISSATELMWQLTGRQYQTTSETLRPDFGGASVLSLDLGKYPVISIGVVRIDGETLPASAYWVADDKYLQRVDGAAWPATQKQYLSDTEADTFSVNFTWGVPAPVAVKSATRRLACEMLSMALSLPSSLSDRIRSASRQGTSFDLVSTQDLLNENGRTGIFEIDLALAAYNSDGNRAMPTVIMTPEDLVSDRAPAGRGAVQGSPGASGAPGASAYQSAVNAGFTGTESEWLTSLAGGWVDLLDLTLQVSADSIQVSALSGYSRYRISFIGASSSTSNAITDIRLRYNGDTAANYGWVQSGGSNTGNIYTARNDASNVSTYMKIALLATSQTSTGRYSVVNLDVVHERTLGQRVYSNGRCITQGSGPVPDSYSTDHGGTWRNPSGDTEITSMLLYPGVGQFIAGTQLRVQVAQ